MLACQNCGANVKFDIASQQMRCEYCGTKVTPVNTKVWSLHKIYEVGFQRV